MRIAFVHPRYPAAEGTGATHSATQIVTGLADAGHVVCVYCSRKPKPDAVATDIELRHLTGNSNHPHTDTRLNKEINARIDELREFDIVHSYLPRLIPSIGNVGRDPSVSTVVTLNAYGGTCAKNDLLYLNKGQCQNKSTTKCLNCISRTSSRKQNGYLYQTTSRLFSLRLINSGENRLQYIDAFRAPSAHVRSNYVNFGYDENKISVIPHPIDDDFCIPHQSDFSEPYKLLYVGSLSKRKGADKLIPILVALRECGTEFELTIVGTGSMEQLLRVQAQKHGVGDAVDFAGFVPNKDLPNVYAIHDLFVFPALWEEPLARVYLESLATGTPIVTSEYGSINEIIGEAGRLTDGSVEQFRDTIIEVVELGLMSKMSKAAVEESKQFDRSRVVEEIEQLYTNIVA